MSKFPKRSRTLPPMSNEEELPVKKRRMTLDILMLPDDLVSNCLARVSRLDYPTLFLVSKRFRSFLTSTDLYQTRTLLGRSESCLYVCLKTYRDSKPLRWFTLARRPNSPTKVLVPIPSPDSLPGLRPDAALAGHNIYVIGGLINDNATSSVMVMDCRSHTWREAPSMRVARARPSACVLDEKIYVINGHDHDATKWMEVFDTKTQTWEFVSGPGEEICSRDSYETIVYDGKVYLKAKKRGIFELDRGRWRKGPLAMDRGCFSSSYCVVDNVLYRCHGLEIHWLDSEERLWKKVKGLGALFKITGPVDSKMANHGGNIAFLWEDKVFVNNRHHETKIWCAEINIERRQDGEIWGTPEWSDLVSTFNGRPYTQVLAHVFAATL